MSKIEEFEFVKTCNGKIYEQAKVVRRYFWGIKIHDEIKYYTDDAQEIKKYL
jgi:hypothetical protein